jgi:hypothetical protein
MNRFILKNTFIKVYIYHFFINIFYKNKRSKLCFEDRVTIVNDFKNPIQRYYVPKRPVLLSERLRENSYS